MRRACVRAFERLRAAGAADGRFVYASNEDAGTASVVGTGSGETLATLVGGTEPEGCRISPDGRWVYITSETSNIVTVIDAESNKVAANLAGAFLFAFTISRTELFEPNVRGTTLVAARGHAQVAGEGGKGA